MIFESDCLLNVSVSDNLVKNYLQCMNAMLSLAVFFNITQFVIAAIKFILFYDFNLMTELNWDSYLRIRFSSQKDTLLFFVKAGLCQSDSFFHQLSQNMTTDLHWVGLIYGRIWHFDKE